MEMVYKTQQQRRCAGPYFYLPKMQSHKEARLWNDVFIEAQDMLNIPRGTIKVLVKWHHDTTF